MSLDYINKEMLHYVYITYEAFTYRSVSSDEVMKLINPSL